MEPIRRRRIASPQLELPNVAPGEPIDSTQADAASSVENVDDGWDVPPTQQAVQDSVAPESTQPHSTVTASAETPPPVAVAASSTSTNDEPEDIRATTQSARDPGAEAPSAKDSSAKDPGAGATAPRRHDMRAPRVRRSTRESELFRQPAAATEPKRPAHTQPSESREPRAETQERRPDLRERRPDLRERRPDLRERRPDLREPRRPERRDSSDLLGPRRPERRDSSDLLGPRRPERSARVVEDSEPARPAVAAAPATSVKPKPKLVPAPVVKAEVAPPPAAPSLEEELRVFGAKPVAERQTVQKADKPRTAKDAMRERARANQEARSVKAPKTLRSGEIEKREANASKPATSTTEQAKNAAPSKAAASSKAATNEESSSEVSTVKPSKHAKAKAKALRKREAKPDVETEEEEIVVVKQGFWARVKSFFTG